VPELVVRKRLSFPTASFGLMRDKDESTVAYVESLDQKVEFDSGTAVKADDNTHPLGEVGILRTVYLSVVKPSTSCSLVMEHAGAEYMGTLFRK
jgi:hypothetical protein